MWGDAEGTHPGRDGAGRGLDDAPHGVGSEVMPPQLLLDPEAREGVGCRLAEESLYVFDFEQLAIVDEQFKSDLQGNILLRWSPWRLWYPGAEVCGTFWPGHGRKIIRKQIAPSQTDGMEDGLRIAPSATVYKHIVAGGGNRQRRVVVVRGTAYTPGAVAFAAATTSLGNRCGTLGSGAGEDLLGRCRWNCGRKSSRIHSRFPLLEGDVAGGHCRRSVKIRYAVW